MLSQDAAIADIASPVAKRMISYREIIEDLRIIVVGVGKARTVSLSDHVHALFPGGRNRVDAFFKAKSALKHQLNEKRPDVVSVQDPFFVGAMAVSTARSMGIPTQVQLHTDCFSSSYMFFSVRNCIETLLAVIVLQFATSVRVVSERIATSVRSVTNRPISVLPIHVEVQPVAAKPRPDVFRDTPALLTVSRLTKEKQVHLLIDAMPEISTADLIIVGDGPLRGALETRAKTRGVSSRVRFVGTQDARAFYPHASVFVQASRYEGYGMALMEAALSGRPIVTTDVGIVGEILKNNESALVVKDSARAIARAVNQIHLDTRLAQRLGENARKNAEAKSVSTIWYLRHYKQALESSFT